MIVQDYYCHYGISTVLQVFPIMHLHSWKLVQVE